jgi:aspartyl-tRNA(Asn)/glutamyl-tRNA(Gln) amidotransferase subunit A
VTGLRFAVPTTVVQDDLSPDVAVAFLTALTRLSEAGAKIIEVPMKEFAQAAEVNPRGAIASYEAYSFHQKWMNEAADKYDPRVVARIRPGEAITAAKYEEHLQSREQFIRSINAAAGGYDAMLMPTVRDIAPTIAEATKDDESYFRLNNHMLRNPSIVNLFDGCALSIPCHEPGSAPVGFTIAGTQNTDRTILTIGNAAEKVIRG